MRQLIPQKSPPASDPADILARTLWGEARGESIRGIEAVACVILNRVSAAQKGKQVWWGRDIISVCQKPFQFSCWNVNDPNYKKLLAVTQEDPLFQICLRIAKRAILGLISDFTFGATHYHAFNAYPSWAQGRPPCATIGNHIFYNDI